MEKSFYSRKEVDIKIYLSILITFLITSSIWFLFGDYLIEEKVIKCKNSYLNTTDIDFSHYPSMFINKDRENLWNNESYKQKYLK